MPKQYILILSFDSMLPKLVCEWIWQVTNQARIPLGSVWKFPGQEAAIICLVYVL